MREHHDRNPAEIQRDIQHTRTELGHTLDAIRDSLTPGALLDRTLDYLKQSGPRQFVSNLGNTVTDNPVPASLIGIGIAWLMVAGSREPSTSSTWSNGNGSGSRLAETASGAAAKAGEAMQSARQRAGELRERAGHTASSAATRAGQVMQGTQERVGGARQRVGDVAYGTQERLRQATDQMQYQTRHQAARAKHGFDYLRSEQPLVLGLLGIALGAVLGAALPPTRREDEMLGEVRDEYISRAQEVGKEHLEKVKQVATSASEQAKEQADKEGLTSENADQSARDLGDKVERVAQATRDAVKTEADKQGLTPQSR